MMLRRRRMIVSLSYSLPVCAVSLFSFQSRRRFFLSQLTRVTQQLCSDVEPKADDCKEEEEYDDCFCLFFSRLYLCVFFSVS